MLKQMLFLALGSAFVYAALASAKSSAKAPKSDAAFLAMAAQADMTVANISKMAEDRATASELKNLATSLVQDHTSDYQQLTALANKVGDTIPKAIDHRNNQTIAELQHSSGKSFDHAFLKTQEAEHEKLASSFKWEAEHGSTPAIKAFAAQQLPTIERHLHDVDNLIKQRS